MCGHSFNGINLAKRYTSGQTVWVSGGTCWGNYMGSLGWERCTCLLCIDWHRYIEKEKGSGCQCDPFGSPPSPPTSQTAVDGARSGSDTLQSLQEIRNQNTELFEQLKILHQMVEQQQQILDKQQKMLEQQRQIETMQKQDDTTGVGESLLSLHEKVDSVLEFCKNIHTEI